MQQEMLFLQLETILCEFGLICETRNALMHLKTILCEFGQTCATGNAFVILHGWHELHFEFSRQNLNQNVQSPFML